MLTVIDTGMLSPMRSRPGMASWNFFLVHGVRQQQEKHVQQQEQKLKQQHVQQQEQQNEAQIQNKPRKWILKDEIIKDIINTCVMTCTVTRAATTTTIKSNKSTNSQQTHNVITQLHKIRTIPNGFWNSKKGKALLSTIESIQQMNINGTLPFVPMDAISIVLNNTNKLMPFGSNRLIDITNKSIIAIYSGYTCRCIKSYCIQ